MFGTEVSFSCLARLRVTVLSCALVKSEIQKFLRMRGTSALTLIRQYMLSDMIIQTFGEVCCEFRQSHPLGVTSEKFDEKRNVLLFCEFFAKSAEMRKKRISEKKRGMSLVI
jgi:hypothetical protein